MEYELHKTNEIIVNLMRPTNFIKQQNKAADLKKWKAIIAAEKERIQQQFLKEIFNCEHENRIQCYVQQHQLALIKLSDRLYRYLQINTTDSLTDLPVLKQYQIGYTEILEQIEQLLLFILEHFGRFCNFDLKIPDSLLVENIPAIKLLANKTKNILNNHLIDEMLTGITCYPIEDFILNSDSVSYKRFEFIKFYQKELTLLLRNISISADDVCRFLIQVNVNSLSFFNYYISQLKLKAETVNDPVALIAYYALQLKFINQFPRDPLSGYESALPCIREQIGSWLNEEIYFLERKHQFEKASITIEETQPANSKVHTRLSVGHLSLAIKLLLDTGVIKNKNLTELIRMVAKNFRTEKSEQISEDSLRNKVYNIETVAVTGMKDVIVGLLNEVRKY